MTYNFYKKQNKQVLIYSIHLINKNSKKYQIKREKNNSTTALMCILK